MTIVYLLVGLIILTAGAEFLVRGSSRLAAAVGVSPLVIGLTIVSYGTSTPELVVSVSSGLKGYDDVAVANVVGSNIFNVLFILGICGLIMPLKVSSQLVRVDVPIMIGASILLLAIGWDGGIGTLDGLLLTTLIVIYTVWSVRKSRQETKAVQQEFAEEYSEPSPAQTTVLTILGQIVLILIGLGLLVWGAQWFVSGSIEIARYLGISEVIIGLTIVAAGTSLPEVATSVVATIKGERDIAIGNVVGSNIYNILAILGIASLVTPGGLAIAPQMVLVDIPVMVIVAGACLPIFFTGLTIDRWEGGLFLAGYVAYTAYLIWSATHVPSASAQAALVAGPLLVG